MVQEEKILGRAYDSRLIWRLLGYLRPYRWMIAAALASVIFKAGVEAIGPYLTKTAIDKYFLGSNGHSWLDRWLSAKPLPGVAAITAIYLSALLVSFVLEYSHTYLMQWMGQKVIFDLRGQLFAHFQLMHVSFYDHNAAGQLVTRVTTDVDALHEMFTSGVISVVEDIFALLFIVAIMLRMKWWLALIVFSVLPVMVWATMVFRRSVRESYRRFRAALARMNAYLQEHVTGMAVVQIFNCEKRAYENFEKINEQHMQSMKGAISAYSLYYPAVEMLSTAAIAAVVWFGGVRVMQGTVTLGILVAFMQYAQRFFRPVQDLSEKFNVLQSAIAAAERVFTLLDTPPEICSIANPQKAEGKGRIEFDGVWFAYRKHGSSEDEGQISTTQSNGFGNPAREYDWVLHDVSFSIEPGETVAIVGHTGAGKTTIISLLMRFYDVQRGAIRIDGTDILNIELSELRRRFGVVLQDPYLFCGTIEDNIRLGSRWISNRQVEAVADQLNVGDFIRTLPLGFQEPVRERGSTLSTGQKQLISFARALAHDPAILILDEATSSIDAQTELRIQDALAKMVKGRTAVIIAHRLSTICRADKIMVMHKGRVREIGTHRELLAYRGIYWKLYQLQYKDQEAGVY